MPIEAISKAAYHRSLDGEARRYFVNHTHVVALSDRHWRLSNPLSSSYWTDIVVLSHGGLVVWGDIELVCFAYGPREKPLDTLVWIADSELDYAAQKAEIGSGLCMRERDLGVALADLYEIAEQESNPENREALAHAINLTIRRETFEEIDEAIWELASDWRVGTVIRRRVATARAACQRLYALLTQSQGEATK